MTGENVLLGLVKVSLDREAGLTVEDESDADAADVSLASRLMFASIVLEAKVKSSSNSLKSATASLATLPAAELAASAAAALLARATEL